MADSFQKKKKYLPQKIWNDVFPFPVFHLIINPRKIMDSGLNPE